MQAEISYYFYYFTTIDISSNIHENRLDTYIEESNLF